MRMLLGISLFLLLGGIVAMVIREDSGYALLSYGGWTAEMSLVTLAVISTLAFAIVYGSIRLLVRAWQLPRRADE